MNIEEISNILLDLMPLFMILILIVIVWVTWQFLRSLDYERICGDCFEIAQPEDKFCRRCGGRDIIG